MKYPITLGKEGLKNPHLVWLVKLCHEKNLSLTDVAKRLTEFGFTAASGIQVTGSHVSNFERYLNLRRTEPHTKNNYKSMNHVVVNKIKARNNWGVYQKLRDKDLLTKELIEELANPEKKGL